MVRWEPDSRGRLEQAALDLYGERGYENTTVAAIAERAGLTERTFFRHFADKREVLFGGGDALQQALVAPLADLPETLTPIDAVSAGLMATATIFGEGRRDFARKRQVIISASPELRERELIKLETLSKGVADALEERGLDPALASLIGEVTIAVFRTAFTRWVADGNETDFRDLIGDSLDQLKALTAGVSPQNIRVRS